MKSETRKALVFHTILLLAARLVMAQGGGTAQISGSVHDATGLAMPGAQIQVTQTDTALTRTVESAPDGSYSLSSLPIGPYRLQVKKQGFNEYVQSGIVLQVDSSPTIDAT